MNICLLQTDIVWGDASSNIYKVERLMTENPTANFYVLPEMWCTGFETAPNEATAAAGEQALCWMKRTARVKQVVIAGSLPLRTTDEQGFRNTLVLATPETTFFYDKHHLFTYGGEPRAYTAGGERVVVSVKGWRILLQVCYDLRFPVFSRSRGGDYDLILYVANWPASRQNAWDTLLRARAIENLCYVVGLNRVGTDPTCTYGGGSAVVAPRGDVLVSLGYAETAVTLSLGDEELAALQRFRQKFPALADADAFTLQSLP